jgi:elongation factor P
MATISDVSTGAVIRHNNELCQIIELQHRTPGNLRAFYQVKMRNIKTGRLAETRMRPSDSVDLVRIDYKTLQYIYREGDNLVCMDKDSYEQVHIPAALFGNGVEFMKEEMEVKVAFEGETPILAEPPVFVELEITYSEPGVKGDTASMVMKPATLETGATVNVPIFVNQGEKIKVDTRTGEYVERVK